eukprot:6199055-Pleurochrysis_carterae.AAC.1
MVEVRPQVRQPHNVCKAGAVRSDDKRCRLKELCLPRNGNGRSVAQMAVVHDESRVDALQRNFHLRVDEGQNGLLMRFEHVTPVLDRLRLTARVINGDSFRMGIRRKRRYTWRPYPTA